MKYFYLLLFTFMALIGAKGQSCLPEGTIFTTQAQIIHVPLDYPTIQQGIDAANEGDTVLVDPQTYLENINFNGKEITVASLFFTSRDTSYISRTIIDGNQNGSVVTFNQGEDAFSILAGFTITNGLTYDGGGINCDGASPFIHHVIVRDNEAHYSGGGIHCFDSNLKLRDSRIADNQSEMGGGMACFFFAPLLENVIIENNYGLLTGGIDLEYSDPVFINTLITGNSSVFCGGLACRDWSSPRLFNVTISGNTSLNYQAGGITLQASDAELVNVIVWNNMPQEIYFEQDDTAASISVAYSDIRGGLEGISSGDESDTVYWLEGNISEDPLFAGS
jgi:hypothetical protein